LLRALVFSLTYQPALPYQKPQALLGYPAKI